MSNKICIFSSDASLGKSILTTDAPERNIDGKIIQVDKPELIDESAPVSIFSICNSYNIDPIIILESSMVSFIQSYKMAQKLKKQLIFGVKFPIVSNAKDKSELSLKTQHSVCVFIKNTDGYRDLTKLYSEIHGNVDNFYYTGRGDFNILHKYWTKNLLMVVPFYSSFVANNTLNYGYSCIPEFGNIKPVFIIENHALPFDELLKEKTVKYCKENKYEMIDGYSCYYYKKDDFKAYQVFRCISERTTFDTPELPHFSSDKFSFENYIKNE